MLAVVIKDLNKENSFELQECPKPIATGKQAVVKISSIGLNRADLLYPQGRYFIKPAPDSRLGFEGAGVVESVGEGSRFKVGDIVATCPMSFNVHTQGCLAEYGLYSDDQLIKCPATITPDQAGALWMAYLTAWGGMVDAGGLAAGQHVVITAASSSVGIAAIQVAKLVGAVSIATTTNQEKADALSDLGADHVIIQSKDDTGIQHYVDRVREITNNQGSDLVFDAVAGPASHGLIKASKREGLIVFHGLLDRRPMDVHAGVLMKRLLTLKGYTLDQTLNHSKKKLEAIKCLTEGFESKTLQPVIAQTFSLKDFKAALSTLSKNAHIGKIIVTP